MGPDARRQYEGWREYVLQHHIEVTTAVLFLTTPTMAMHFFAKVRACHVTRARMRVIDSSIVFSADAPSWSRWFVGVCFSLVLFFFFCLA